MVLAFSASLGYSAVERDAFSLESELQQRIENILSKALPPNSYIVTVKVDMSAPPSNTTVHSRTNTASDVNPFLNQSKYMLPGVPEKKDFVEPQKQVDETTVNAFAAETLVRRITISILVSPDISNDQIRALRDFISSSVPFNPLRGDEMDIQRSPLLKRTSPSDDPPAKGAVTPPEEKLPRPANIFGGLSDRSTLLLVIILGGIILILTVLVIFLFGPVRAFLNRLLTVLPRIGEQAAYTVTNAPTKPSAPPALAGGPDLASLMTGDRRRFHGNGADIPFHFIREEQLVKLPMLIKQMNPEIGAIILAYLPPEWASRVFGALDVSYQTSLVKELSQSKEIPAEIVKDIESQVKAKLPYLVGGTDWIQSVYQMTQPQTQRAILGTLNQQSPELAKALRRKTFFFEDLAVLPMAGLRLLIQESGFGTIAQALREEKAELREAVVRRLPPAMREIMEQELELAADDNSASAEAKAKVTALARQMLQDGRISFGEKK